ncbi:hypothetical protein, partial [Paraburkholderia sp.]|uniref:hypothetical protein n=1 Tax=Paraburkholderia sp. TaxID=1926495 RepID=UPI003C7C98A2
MIVLWLRRHGNDLGKCMDVDADNQAPMIAVSLVNVVVIGGSVGPSYFERIVALIYAAASVARCPRVLV